jgi:hypothetical protein
MPANTNPIFTLTPNVGRVTITQAAANVKSDGVGTVGTDNFLVFTAGANGSFVERVRFMSVASAAATAGVATTLRVFLSTVNTGGTTAADTFLIGEISVPAITSSHSTNATAPYELALNIAIPTGMYILVSQHVAQTANQNWIAVAIGGDY